MRPVIVDVSIAEIHAEVRDCCRALEDAEARESSVAKSLETLRDHSYRRRVELGHALIRARKMWPARGPRAKGWGEFLATHKLDDSTARRYMEYAGYCEEQGISLTESEKMPTYADAGIDNRGREAEVDASTDSPMGKLIPLHASAGDAPDRNSWCTPEWLCDALGRFDLDPCSNSRSHVRAKHRYDLELRGEDGLDLAHETPKNYRVFVNPPYGPGLVLKWVEAYKHTRFTFLLRLDTSTEWFEEIAAASHCIFVPRRNRIEFEPPPGVTDSTPRAAHCLFYAREEDATAAIRKLCFAPWRLR